MLEIMTFMDEWGVLIVVSAVSAVVGFMVGVAMAQTPEKQEPSEFYGDQM